MPAKPANRAPPPKAADGTGTMTSTSWCLLAPLLEVMFSTRTLPNPVQLLFVTASSARVIYWPVRVVLSKLVVISCSSFQIASCIEAPARSEAPEVFS